MSVNVLVVMFLVLSFDSCTGAGGVRVCISIVIVEERFLCHELYLVIFFFIDGVRIFVAL